ncbi:aldo/keto reductase [Aestuariimicrobium ganziense]|uniref:aldo/keto reductase n=1 Tax=Aestuariimicrobium ganziense TaxID=2773677 RepID=UPI001940955F|nr:aldo/keto reductase [Aestuariimicrobium ganziense]
MTAPTVPTVTLLNGLNLPALGLGTASILGDDAVAAVKAAISAGYRLIDTAENYKNEEAVGQGIRESGLDRDEILITSKFNKAWHSVDGVRQAWQASCERLGVDHIDVFLCHWPNPDQDRYVEAVKGLKALLDDGSIRAIGVSNFKPTHLQRVLDETGIVPDLNQIQLSPYANRADARAWAAEHGMVTESWSPIGGRDGALRGDPLLAEIGGRHGKSAAQVVLRWHHQMGLVAIPRSSNPGRMAENLDIFDFELTDDEMAQVTGLGKGAEAEVVDSDNAGH